VVAHSNAASISLMMPRARRWTDRPQCSERLVDYNARLADMVKVQAEELDYRNAIEQYRRYPRELLPPAQRDGMFL
jgi:hypothetical protein